MKILQATDIVPESENVNWTNQILIMRAEVLGKTYRKPQYQLWRAESGFGCHPTLRGKGIYATCLNDGEESRWSRYDFLGIAKPALVQELVGNSPWLNEEYSNV